MTTSSQDKNTQAKSEKSKTDNKKKTEGKKINLALQGGGAHGAFTWGVLDRLLEEPDLGYEAISGTSAGAMNGAVMAEGYLRGGREGARERLEFFWKKISEHGRYGMLQRTPWDKCLHGWNLDLTPQAQFFDFITRVFSPYETNVTDYHPLRDILQQTIDFDNLRRHSRIKLFINTTNVNSGKVRVFSSNDLTSEVLLASACLPFLFKAIEIDGEYYWDGGYMGNPAIFPLIYGSPCTDVVVIQINPFRRDNVPKTAREILDRVNEVSFNSSLMREMRVVAFIARMVEEERLDSKRYKRLNIHFISAEEEMRMLGFASKLNAEWEFLTYLRDLGRKTTDLWLKQNYEAINVRSTVDLEDMFL